MEIALRNKSGTRFGSIVGMSVGILGFGVGKGILVPSGVTNENVGRAGKSLFCAGVDSIVAVALGMEVAVGWIGVTWCVADPHEVTNKPTAIRILARKDFFMLPTLLGQFEKLADVN